MDGILNWLDSLRHDADRAAAHIVSAREERARIEASAAAIKADMDRAFQDEIRRG